MNTKKYYNNPLLDVARLAYCGIVWTHKVHEKEREIVHAYVNLVRWGNVVLIGATFVLTIIGIIINNIIVLILGCGVCAISASFVIYQLSFSPDKQEQEHRMAAKSFLELRDKYLLVMALLMSDTISEEEFANKLESLQMHAALAYKNAPNSSRRAYKKAKESLQIDEEGFFSDQEINALLPKSLHVIKENGAQLK